MKKITLIFLMFSGILQAQQKPNIVFILTDDQSYNLLGCTGNPIVQTPHIDKLANNGMLFTNAHVTSAICTPSRISILLSQYERKHGVNFNSGTSVSDTAWKNSYPVIMRNNGYYTGWVGKNHAPIGYGGYNSGVMEKSFDYWYAGHGHLGFYPKDNHTIFNDAIAFTQPEIINEGVDDFLDPNARKLKGALHFLDNRPSNKPFMLSINFNLPHGASTKTMKMKTDDDTIYKTLYRNLDIPLPDNYIAKADIKTPKLPKELLHAEDRQEGYNYVDTPEGIKERYIRELESMTGIDRLVGNLVKKLKDLKLDKNTIIIFTSDHGLFGGQQGLGGKALCYEQTTHVPIIINTPQMAKKVKGSTTNVLAQTIDIAPTLLSLAGIEIPNTYQGKDLSNIINGDKDIIRDYAYTENLWSTHFGNPRCESVQNQKWKYIRYYKNDNFSAKKEIKYAKEMGIPVNEMLYKTHDPEIAKYRSYIDAPTAGELAVYEELYNLKSDPNELHNVVSEKKNADILETLRNQWKIEITKARGTGKAEVYRYTNDLYPDGKH
ncbi:arylsulfatase [Formosa agariphila KMM 3901]|uniref:Arylsulfatase n=1 Tax=Formosa agariphila (strain DSM 15362 / KCTC 12365 / LMG 23005 / KMM 3901 / M-2Alg 35-1) TaxID=1347342 RepID=T2KM81_FORAG|nr:sulfatase-like hydrolase/transferase [Formosa agariphila]CDF79810.1 arylsulfatase [Formosa agariphila KMM 3901]